MILYGKWQASFRFDRAMYELFVVSSQVSQTVLLLWKTKSLVARHRNHRNHGFDVDFNYSIDLNYLNLIKS
jgi:hypothetical protein